jgi:hypothetical protein
MAPDLRVNRVMTIGVLDEERERMTRREIKMTSNGLWINPEEIR